MTVQAQDSVQYYDGPINVGAVIPITDFTFIDNSHVSLKIRGIDEIWEYGTDYTIEGADTLTRTITLNRAVEAGQVLAAYLDVPITQNISPEEGGNFPASTNEFVLDKLTCICQMLYERITRALQVSIDTPFNGTLPDPEGKANRIIALNSTGTGLAYSTYDVAKLEYIANRLYTSIDNVDITANNIEDVITTAANILSVNTVAEAIQNVVTTAESIANVNIVGNDLALGVDSAINKVNANKENIDINAANIEDIQNAKVNAQTCIDKALEAATNANRANTNANKATIWAEGTDEQVETLGGKHSAKGWAEVASQGQIQADWEQEDATKKDYIKNKPNLDTGYFPGVHVGLANNLYDASAPVDISSFWFRTSAGAESITTGTAALRALRGNMLNSGYTPRSGNYTASSGITVNNFDLDAFEANNPSTGIHVFQYNRPNWTLNGSIITPGSWGLDVTPRPESLSITVVGGIAASCTDTSTFDTAVGNTSGSYTFTFADYNDEETGIHVGPYWTYNGEEINLVNYALSVTGTPVNGNSIIVNYTAPLLTGTVTIDYIKEVLGTLTPAVVDYLFATVSMNQYDKNGIGRLTHIINNATIDNTGKIISGTGKVACVRAVGGIHSGYVAYSESQHITRIAHTPLVWNNSAVILPVIGDTLSLEDTTQDAELSVALFDLASWVCVAVTDDSDLSIHPRWSSGQDQDHTYDEYSDNHVEIPKADKSGVALPTGLYGMPAIGTVFDEIRFETVNTYTKRIERVANTVDNMAMVQAYGTQYLYDSNYIFYVLKDVDIVVYELGDVSSEYIVNDYGTEALVATTPDNMCTLNISYGTNLKDKLRTNVLTISQQDLTQSQQLQVRTNIGIDLDNYYTKQELLGQISNCITKIPQDIKLEFVDGTLTLKAGSKLYIPNGFEEDGTTPKFDILITEEDKNIHGLTGGAEGDVFIFYAAEGDTFISKRYYGITSGATASAPDAYSVWYNTTTNKILQTSDSGTTWSEAQITLPLCVITVSLSQILSLDEVFNGIGFLGSSAYSLPGIEMLFPIGRAENGKLKSRRSITETVQIRTWEYACETQPLFLSTIGELYSAAIYFISTSQPVDPTIYKWAIWFNPQENKTYYTGTHGYWSQVTNWLPTHIAFAAAKSTFKLRKIGNLGAQQAEAENIKIIAAYMNGNSGFRIFSDGTCEQWGAFKGSAGVAVSANILIPYQSTDWNLQLTSGDCYDAVPIVCDGRVTSSSTFVYTHGMNNQTYSEWLYWRAIGKVF